MFSTGKPKEGSIYAKLTTLLSSPLSLLSLDEVACHLLSAPAPHRVRFSAAVGVSRVKKTVGGGFVFCTLWTLTLRHRFVGGSAKEPTVPMLSGLRCLQG